MHLNLKAVFEKLMGRTTAFLLAFFVSGHIMAFFHKLDASYLSFLTIMMGYVVGKSHLDNKNDQAMAALNGSDTTPAVVPGPPDGYQPPGGAQ